MKRKISIGLLLFLIGGAIVFGAALSKDMRQKLESIRMASEVFDRNGRLVGNLYYYRRIWVPIEQIPRNLQNAVVAIEDARFYQHNGIDMRGMARAVVHNIFSPGDMEGGSTITQQLAKISLLSSERTLSRKVQDISFALEIEKVYTKKEILELYLNSTYLAHGNVGIEAAARFYFGKPAGRLNLEESALIAALIRSPENYSPLKHFNEAKKRRNLVLKKMLEQKMISADLYKKTVARGLFIVKQSAISSSGSYFLDYLRDYLIKNEGYNEEKLRSGGYKIYTTLDLAIQTEADRAVAALPNFSTKVQPQAALVTLDPRTGEILAMVGGRSYAKSQFNRCVKSYRQPGSAIKPFVYATALEKGFTAASIVEDQPLTITLPNGREWKPENYDHKYRGKITLREALKQSINTVAIQVLQQVGVDAVARQMEHMGINSLVKKGDNNDLNLAPLALGGLTKGVTPLELASSYTPFANQGLYAKPYVIRKILDGHGNLLKEFPPPEQGEPVLSPQSAYIMTSMMEDVIKGGTGHRAILPDDRPAAGKTGTTSDYTNAWFVGYTPDLLTAVWIGNDRQDQPMVYKEGNIGSATAAEIWGSYMKRITTNRPVLDFEEPSGILWVDVNPETGEAVPGWLGGNSYKEVFAENSVPESTAYKIWHWFFRGKKTEKQLTIPDEKTEDQTKNPEIPDSPVVSSAPENQNPESPEKLDLQADPENF